MSPADMSPVELVACAAGLLFGLAVVIGVLVDAFAGRSENIKTRNPEDWER